MLFIALILAVVAFALLALGMDKHYRQFADTGLTPNRRIAFRAAGSLLLTASAAVSVASRGWEIGLTWWFCLLSIGAMTVLLTISYVAPAKSRR